MITTVTLNAAIDKTYFLPTVEMGHVHRVQQMYSEPGGKGINVAKVLHTLGHDVTAAGFLGGFNGKYVADRLERMGIRPQFTTVKEETRLCLNFVDEARGRQTEILEAGPRITKDEWAQLQARIDSLAAKSEFVVFSGSLPQGLPADTYAQLIRHAHRYDAKAILDTSGPPLAKSLAAKPFMVKPNREELAAFMGTEVISERDILEVMGEWRALGIPLVVVSLGDEGAFVSYRDTIFKATPPSVKAVNPVGCGDTLVAGIVAGFMRGLDIEETMCLATAAAAVNATVPQAGYVTVDEVNALKPQVKITWLA